MRFRSGRAVASGVGLTVLVTSVAVAAAPPGGSARTAQRKAAQIRRGWRFRAPAWPGPSPPRPCAHARACAPRSAATRSSRSIEQTGGLKAVGKLDGYLTGASSADAESVALGYVRAHAAAFGLSASDLDALKLVRDYTSLDGVRHLQWAQVVDGVTVADSSLLANVTREGRLINVLGGARGGLSAQPALPRRQRRRRVQRARCARSAPGAPCRHQRSARSTGTRTTTYAGSGQAELVAYHAGSGLRLAWRVLAPVGRNGDYDTLVDAADGRIVRRANLVKFADALVTDDFPGDHPGGTQTTKPIGQWLEPGRDRLRRRQRTRVQGRPRRGRHRC